MIQYPNYNNPYAGYPQMPNVYANQMQAQAQMPVQNQTQIQNSGFVSVHSEAEARNYPVAHGNSITFKDENAPYVYVKTMGFSQLDRPTFERFKLVKEDAEQTQEQSLSVIGDNSIVENIKGDIEAIKGDIEGIKKQVKSLQAAKNKRLVKELIEEDEDND